MNKNLLKSVIVGHGETQSDLAEAMGITLSRLSAKINEYRGASFRQNEITFIKNRYGLSPEQIDAIFFAK